MCKLQAKPEERASHCVPSRNDDSSFPSVKNKNNENILPFPLYNENQFSNH